MGAHSTMNITRADATAEIIRHILRATDEELESVLFDLVGNDLLYNFRIVGSYSDDSSDREYAFGKLD